MERRRIWTEFLPPEELRSPATLRLLRRFCLQPLIALPPERETEGMARALHALRAHPIGLWPLLRDGEGYWPSSENAACFAIRARQALRFAAEAGARPATLAVDLEPTEALKRALLGATPLGRAQLLLRRHQRAGRPEHESRFRDALGQYALLAAELRSQGIESLAIAVPPLVLDLAAGRSLWQRLFTTPVQGAGWSTISPMIYSSMIRDTMPRKSARAARALLAGLCHQVLRGVPSNRLCLSLGVVGPGKLGDESSLASPEQLALDVAIARSAGITDLALFSLEGVLAREHPERWLESFTMTAPASSFDARERMAHRLARVTAGGGVALTRMLGRA